MSGMFGKLFKQGPGVKNVITLFHSPNSSASVRAQTILKQAHAQAVAHATEDQASSHNTQAVAERNEFELDVTEEDPTKDQLRSILEFLHGGNVGKVVEGASNESEALQKINKFQRPVTVDWSQGKVVVGDNESEILKMLKEIPKETDKS